MQLDPLMLQVLMWDIVILISVGGYLVGFYLLYKFRMHSPEYSLGRAILREQAMTQSKIIMGRINRILQRVYPEVKYARGEITAEEKEKIKVPDAAQLGLEEVDRILAEADRLGILDKAKQDIED